VAAITAAAAVLGAGDVIIIEQQYQVCGTGRFGPLEAVQSVFDTISYVTAVNDIVVVAAAGNGNVNLDDPACAGLFDRSVRDSGAIIVGAGSSSGRQRMGFSSYGSRVDVQGWGENVTTTGYGPGDVRRRYTHGFSGTSSATPIVAGAVLAIQGRLKACGKPVATPEQIREILVNTGTAQGGASPATEHIGPLPNISEALRSLAVLTCASATAAERQVASRQ
jgi:serine protease